MVPCLGVQQQRQASWCHPDAMSCPAAPFTTWLAGKFPDEPLQQLQTSQEDLFDLCQQLMDKQRAQVQAAGAPALPLAELLRSMLAHAVDKRAWLRPAMAR